MNAKEIAGKRAIERLWEGMTLGLGTGSTVYYTTLELAKMINKGFQITIVSTSNQTTELANSLNIPLADINSVPYIDITIDGADEVDSDFNGIKGGGGALLREKIVATNSKKNIWVADSSKLVNKLGAFPLPVEIVAFGSKQLIQNFAEKGFNPSLRMNANHPFITDSLNLIVDLNLKNIENAAKLQEEIKKLPGVVETGLFINICDEVIVGYSDHYEELKKF